MNLVSKKAALRCGVALVALVWGGTAWAQTKDFNVPAEDAVKAIPEFARQAGIQIVAPADQLKGVKTPALSGAIDLHVALSRLLDGTGIEIASDDGQTIVLRVRPKNAQAASNEAAVRAPETVVVVGTRIPQTVKEGAQEVRTYTKQQIDQSGQGTIADFLSTLPDVSMSSIDSAVGSYADQTTVRLHGLPVGTTLVLLNGRRVEINNYGFFDLNNIPVAALERVEVLPVGSSAIYGADALAGAVNFVLKKDFTGLDANVRYGHANGTDEFDANLSGGYAWDNASLSLIASYQSRSELLGAERAITRDPNNLLAAFGEGDICHPGTVFSQNGGNLPGLSSPVAAIPPGLSGKPSISDFNGTAGTVNRCSINIYSDMLPPVEREGILASGEIRLADWAVPFFELLVSHETVDSKVGNLITFFHAFGSTLPASNAFNPFGQNVGISYTFPGLPFKYDRSTTFLRPLIGLRGDLGGGWDYELTGLFSYDTSHVTQNNNMDFGKVLQALASPDPATALNVFAQGAPGSSALLASFFGPPHILKFYSQNYTTEAIARGPLFELDSGPVQAVFGAEYDHSKLYTYQQDQATISAANRVRRDAYAAFTELRIPLWANRENPAAGERLAVGLAGRFDDSDDFGSRATGQVNVEARPMDSLLIRGGYATSYQAPQLSQLAGAGGSFFTSGYIDPFRGNEAVLNVQQFFGPNPNLKPETGEGLQFGLVYRSEMVPGLVFSATRWDIRITNYIGTPNAQDLIDFPNLFPGAITRGQPSPQDIQNGFPGPIIAIHDVFYNFGRVHVSGVDLDLNYTADTDFGQLTPSLSFTETDRFTSSLSPSLPPTSSLSKAAFSVGFAPHWKGTAAIGWTFGPYGLNLAGRYIGPYLDYQDFGPNKNRLGDFWYTDANFRYDLGKGFASDDRWLSGAYVQIGAVNLFNTMPQKSHTFANFDSAEADIRGRFIYFQVGESL